MPDVGENDQSNCILSSADIGVAVNVCKVVNGPSVTNADVSKIFTLSTVETAKLSEVWTGFSANDPEGGKVAFRRKVSARP